MFQIWTFECKVSLFCATGKIILSVSFENSFCSQLDTSRLWSTGNSNDGVTVFPEIFMEIGESSPMYFEWVSSGGW